MYICKKNTHSNIDVDKRNYFTFTIRRDAIIYMPITQVPFLY